jgi:hypothetical protein
MRSLAAVLGLCLVLSGCGTHRITYIRSSLVDARDTYTLEQTHAHGIGPLLIGGGGYFGIFNEMSPALIDYTGAVNLHEICPYGFSKVSHHHKFWHSALAAVISWAIVVNAYHLSEVEITCLGAHSQAPTDALPVPAP